MKKARRSRRPPHAEGGKAADKFVDTVHMATYAEYNYFSERNFLWRRYRTKSPRMPTEKDRLTKWTNTLFQPALLNTFFGTENKKVINTFIVLKDSFETSGVFPSLFILAGPAGSGKTSLVQALLSEMCDIIGAKKSTASDFLLEVDCERTDPQRVWSRVESFAKGTPSARVPYKIVVLDGADHIPPTSQQLFKKVFAETEKKTKYIFICRSLSKMTGHVQAKGAHYATHLSSERDALGNFLRVLEKEKIGFNRLGLEFLFKTVITKMNLRECVEIMQQTFVEHSFLSQENIEKVFLKRRGRRLELTMPASRAVQPLTRCNVCTLMPPCAHTNMQKLEELAHNRRKELPIHKGGMTCHHYLKHGYCAAFNQYGACSLDHPRGLHKIVKAAQRDALIATLERLHGRLRLLKQIAVEAPPIALTSHLAEEIPDYPRQLLKLRKAIPMEKEVALKRAQEWTDSSMSVLKEDYSTKDKLLRVTFESLLNSRLLDPPESFIKQEEEGEEEEGEGEEGGGDDDDDDSDENDDDDNDDGRNGSGSEGSDEG